jgi:hypothetical protein
MLRVRTTPLILLSLLLSSLLAAPVVGQEHLRASRTFPAISSAMPRPSTKSDVGTEKMQNKARRIDKYGSIPFDDEMARLDIVVIRLQGEPGARAVIIAYGGRQGSKGAAQARVNRATRYLIERRGIEEGRIRGIDGGFREEFTVEIWLVPVGASPPQPTPTVRPDQVQPPPSRRTRRRQP